MPYIIKHMQNICNVHYKLRFTVPYKKQNVGPIGLRTYILVPNVAPLQPKKLFG